MAPAAALCVGVASAEPKAESKKGDAGKAEDDRTGYVTKTKHNFTTMNEKEVRRREQLQSFSKMKNASGEERSMH